MTLVSHDNKELTGLFVASINKQSCGIYQYFMLLLVDSVFELISYEHKSRIRQTLNHFCFTD